MIINCHHYAWNRFINTETITPLAQSCLIKGIQINAQAYIKLRPLMKEDIKFEAPFNTASISLHPAFDNSQMRS